MNRVVGNTVAFWAIKFAQTDKGDAHYYGRIHNFNWKDLKVMRRAGFRIYNIMYLCDEGVIKHDSNNRITYTHRERWPLPHYANACYDKNRCVLTKGFELKGRTHKHIEARKKEKKI